MFALLPYVVYSSEYWVDLNELYVFRKANYEETDKKDMPKRANIRIVISKYELLPREIQERTLFILTSIIKHFFHHSQDFSICRQTVDQKIESLLVKKNHHSFRSRSRWPSWMCRPTEDQEVAGSTPAEVGNILSWRLIMKYFLRSFSPFRWFKKGSCQFLAKECAQYWLTA